MKVNVKKLDETIAKLQELRRLATDPALSSFVVLSGRASSNGHSPQSETESNGNGNGRASLKPFVLAACKTLEGKFTVKDVYTAMGKLGTADKGTEGSVGNTLRLLAIDGEIQILIKGQGRRPQAYGNV